MATTVTNYYSTVKRHKVMTDCITTLGPSCLRVAAFAFCYLRPSTVCLPAIHSRSEIRRPGKKRIAQCGERDPRSAIAATTSDTESESRKRHERFAEMIRESAQPANSKLANSYSLFGRCARAHLAGRSIARVTKPIRRTDAARMLRERDVRRRYETRRDAR